MLPVRRLYGDLSSDNRYDIRERICQVVDGIRNNRCRTCHDSDKELQCKKEAVADDSDCAGKPRVSCSYSGISCFFIFFYKSFY